MQPQRVLIVDDEPALRTALEAAFDLFGFEVVTAENGEIALGLLAGGGFDLLLLDKNLPGMSGLEVLRRVRQLPHPPCSVLMTAYASPESVEQAFALGARAYAQKPVRDILAFIQQLQSYLNARPPAPAQAAGVGRAG